MKNAGEDHNCLSLFCCTHNKKRLCMMSQFVGGAPSHGLQGGPRICGTPMFQKIKNIQTTILHSQQTQFY